MNPLGRVADPRALDQATGSCGRIRVVIPSAWARRGASISVDVPTRVECGVCRGGGCDRCQRSGAVRLSVPAEQRTLELSLPPLDGEAVLLRVPHPFGDGLELDCLNVEIAAGEHASTGCRLISSDPALAPGTRAVPANVRANWFWLAVATLLLFVAALSFWAQR